MTQRFALGTYSTALLPFEKDRLIAEALRRFPQLADLDLTGQGGKYVVVGSDGSVELVDSL